MSPKYLGKVILSAFARHKHAWSLDHAIDFDAAEVIDKGNFRTRKTLECWHTALSDQADNNSKPLPGQYTMLTKKR